jgi:hypothetical protein
MIRPTRNTLKWGVVVKKLTLAEKMSFAMALQTYTRGVENDLISRDARTRTLRADAHEPLRELISSR